MASRRARPQVKSFCMVQSLICESAEFLGKNKGETAVFRLRLDSIMPHVEGVKREFAGLDVAIVPNGTPNRRVRYDHLFVL